MYTAAYGPKCPGVVRRLALSCAYVRVSFCYSYHNTTSVDLDPLDITSRPYILCQCDITSQLHLVSMRHIVARQYVAAWSLRLGAWSLELVAWSFCQERVLTCDNLSHVHFPLSSVYHKLHYLFFYPNKPTTTAFIILIS